MDQVLDMPATLYGEMRRHLTTFPSTCFSYNPPKKRPRKETPQEAAERRALEHSERWKAMRNAR